MINKCKINKEDDSYKFEMEINISEEDQKKLRNYCQFISNQSLEEFFEDLLENVLAKALEEYKAEFERCVC